jgi:hypothetical protein
LDIFTFQALNYQGLCSTHKTITRFDEHSSPKRTYTKWKQKADQRKPRERVMKKLEKKGAEKAWETRKQRNKKRALGLKSTEWIRENALFLQSHLFLWKKESDGQSCVGCGESNPRTFHKPCKEIIEKDGGSLF